MLRGHIHNGQRVQHPPRANIAAGLAAAVRAPDQQTAGGNDVQIMLSGGGAIHLLIHGGHDGDRRGRSETNRRNEIVGHPCRDASD